MAQERTILHCDMNCFYASCEMAYHPELQGKPIAVCGDPERRSGIVLTASYPAKRMGVKTGMPLWEAQQHCRDIIFVPAHYDMYTRFSGYTREIFLRFTDQVEPFGLDEAWLDCTGSRMMYGDGLTIAKKISDTIKDELGITCSIGVSWNKTLAKLGSDYKKPDAITVINRENFKDIVFPLPASDLLYVGSKTSAKLANYAVHTIGDLAQANPKFIQEKLGKVGIMIWQFANGMDTSAVAKYEYKDVVAPIKSIGNSWTTPRDLMTDEDVWIVLYLLSESVAARLRENHFRCRGVEVTLRDSSLFAFERQTKLGQPTMQEREIAQAAYLLYKKNYRWNEHLRSIGVRAIDLRPDTEPSQISFDYSAEKQESMEKLESAIDGVRNRFGYYSVQRCVMYKDRFLSHCDERETIQYTRTGICRGAFNSICLNSELRNMWKSSQTSCRTERSHRKPSSGIPGRGSTSQISPRYCLENTQRQAVSVFGIPAR